MLWLTDAGGGDSRRGSRREGPCGGGSWQQVRQLEVGGWRLNAGYQRVKDWMGFSSDSSVALNTRGWKLTHIFNTHHHGDHVGANLELKVAARVAGRRAEGGVQMLDRRALI